MEYIEDTIEELQPDGTIALRKVIVPVYTRPSYPPGSTEQGDDGYVPLGEPIKQYEF